MRICSLDPPDLSRNSTADVALEHWGRRGPRGCYFLAVRTVAMSHVGLANVDPGRVVRDRVPFVAPG